MALASNSTLHLYLSKNKKLNPLSKQTIKHQQPKPMGNSTCHAILYIQSIINSIVSAWEHGQAYNTESSHLSLHFFAMISMY